MKALRSLPARSGSDETRKRLLDAATAVFAEHGYQRATVRDICRQADVNVALINYHFGDKLELYTEVLRTSLKDARNPQEIRTLLAEPGPPAILFRKFIRLMLERMFHERASGAVHMRLMLHEMAHPTPAFIRVVDETIKPMHEALRTFLARMLGVKPDDDRARFCAQSVIGQVIHYAHHLPVIARLWPELKMTAAQREMVAEHIASFSLSYIQMYRDGAGLESPRPPRKTVRRVKRAREASEQL